MRNRIPAAYLLHRAYLQGVGFYIDERVIVPRSYLAELLYGDFLFRGDAPLIDPASVTRVLDLCTGSGASPFWPAMYFRAPRSMQWTHRKRRSRLPVSTLPNTI